MIKILSIIPYTVFPAITGGQRCIALFNEYLAKETELISVTVKSNDPFFAKGYSVYNILSTAAFRYINLFYFFTLRQMIRRRSVTHLMLEHPYYGWLGILLKQFTGVKLIIHSHNIESTRWKSLGKWWWKILWWYERTIHRHADFNFFIQDEDRKYALEHFRLQENKCTTITYGTEIAKAPEPGEKEACKTILQQRHQIAAGETIFLFNGTLDYKPNYDALNIILHTINPLLLQAGILYKIIICGKNLPAHMHELKEFSDKNIIYVGFVDDITVYFKGADIFLNPTVDGGGIKTKLVEALGFDTKTISSYNGSIGVLQEDAGQQLIIVPDRSWPVFAQQMIQASRQPKNEIPVRFYKKFYWGNIARKAAGCITAINA